MLDVYLALTAMLGGLLWLMLLGLRRLVFGRRHRAAQGPKAAAPGKAEGVKTFHVVASSQQGVTLQHSSATPNRYVCHEKHCSRCLKAEG